MLEWINAIPDGLARWALVGFVVCGPVIWTWHRGQMTILSNRLKEQIEKQEKRAERAEILLEETRKSLIEDYKKEIDDQGAGSVTLNASGTDTTRRVRVRVAEREH